MTVFLTCYEESIRIRARAERPDMEGDLEHKVRPGDRFFGVPYDLLRSAGDGEHDLDALKMRLIDDTFLNGPACAFCKHLTDVVDGTCAAFPYGIPDEIWSAENNHRAPFEGDRGIQFEWADGFDAEEDGTSE